MTPDEAIRLLEEKCNWCSFRQASRHQECVSCPIEHWKQQINIEQTKRMLNLETLSTKNKTHSGVSIVSNLNGGNQDARESSGFN